MTQKTTLYNEVKYDKQITGVMFTYSLICKRKLWFYANGICMEQDNEYVEIGKSIDESTYNRERKNILIDNKINIDYLKNGIIYEIKKSKAQKESSIYQIKYYLYVLKQKGIKNLKGILKIPKEKYQEVVFLTDKDETFIEEQLQIIDEIINSDVIPIVEKKSICQKCAYYEFCSI